MLQIQHIKKEYRTGSLVQKALDDVSLNLRDNEFVAILGPSGSGKTTLLNIIGGLDRYDSGDLIINGISTKKYKDRDWDSYRNHTIGFVFQSYNLIPHQTVLANVELALTISGVGKEERRKRAVDALEKVGLGQQLHKKPNQMSGGQMQRVAIARALVNDPEILLADEPTGALDSDTSVQVMDLLREVAKDRLVVMVTHNPELAEQYATRIVNLKDGKIRSDTDEYIVEEENLAPPEHKNMGKSSMSLLTALSLSFNNLRTKKARTLLTSFAGSIGIIGIALILALSNGVNAYIRSIEEETLSEYPLQIQSTGFDLTSMMVGMNGDSGSSDDKKSGKDKDKVKVMQVVTNMFSKMDSNDLGALKKYLDSGESKIHDYTKAIEYSYNVMPQLFRQDGDNVRQVNPDQSFSSLGLGASSGSNSLMSSMMSTNVFFEMPENTDLYEDQYDVKAGRWPKKYNECVVVLTSSGKISDMMAYTLGLRDSSELDQMVQQFANEEDVDVTLKEDDYSYQDILNKTFKLVKSADYYEYDEQYHVYKDKSNDQTYMNQLVQNGEDLKIVGIVQPKDAQTATMLSTGIYYPSSLVQHIIEKSSTTQIVQDQLKNKNMNIFTGKAFEEKNSQFDLSSLFTIDQNKMQSAFKFNTQALQLDFTNLNQELTNLSLPTLDMNQIINQIQFNVSSDQLDHLANSLLNGYLEYEKNHPEVNINQATQEFINYLQTDHARQVIEEQVKKYIEDGIDQNEMQQIINAVLDDYKKQLGANDLDITKINEYLMSYLNSQEAKNILTQEMTSIIQSTNIETQISQIMSQYMQSSMQNLSSSLQRGIQKSMMSMSSSMENAFQFDSHAFAEAMSFSGDENDFMSIISSMMTSEQDSYDNNIKKLGYADFKKPASISIYPKNFESKEKVIQFLDNYNKKMEKTTQDDKVITYTDFVGTLMSSVTDIVNVISYVLVAFVGISLVVSSIMIGVITYISVLERKKEIGILRAIGASKRNISQVFNAETFIIGLFAGLIGIIITLIALIPANIVIHNIADTTAVNASLPPVAGIVLIILSVILTLLGGIVPSKKAAKEDPVTALRTD